MKSLLITFCTLVFLVALSFIPVTAGNSDANGSTTNTGSGQYSWQPETVWCRDLFGTNYHMVTQCDQAGGACSDQYCPCTGTVIEF